MFKAAELRDYFRDDCVDTALAKITTLDVVAQTAVVIYPIVLSDRTELLVSLPNGLKRLSIPVRAETLTEEVAISAQAGETYNERVSSSCSKTL